MEPRTLPPSLPLSLLHLLRVVPVDPDEHHVVLVAVGAVDAHQLVGDAVRERLVLQLRPRPVGADLERERKH